MSRSQRLKSAHGRLQSSVNISAEASGLNSRGGEGTPRIPRSRRVKSARQSKLEQESSVDVFPPVEPGDSDWGRTQYGDDFGRKRQPVTPVPVRPISPTRRNNPHPAKPFMQWKLPVRVHEHKKSMSPPEEAWNYVSESFYDDYIDTKNTGDAKNEVPVTNLATIDFPGNKKNGNLSPQHQLVSGTRLQLNPRNSFNKTDQLSPSIIRPPSPKSRMMHNTVRSTTLPVLREWLKTASTKERELVLQMLTAAHTDSEDTRLQKAIDDVLRPDSAAQVQKWLQAATPSERKTLLGVLETLAVASAPLSHCQPHLVAFPSPVFMPPDSHHRSYSYPITLRPRTSHNHSKSHTSSHYSRHSHCHHHHHKHTSHRHHHHHHRASESELSKKISGGGGGGGGGGGEGGDMTLVGRKVGVRGEKTPELWHHKIPGPVTDELKVIHPASVFQLPHKDRGRHFAIHPEWPTA